MPARGTTRSILALLIVLALGHGPNARAGDTVILEVSAGSHDRQGTMVAAELPAALGGHRHFTLACLETGKPVPVQVDRTAAPCVRWIVADKLAAGATRRYRLAASEQPAPGAGGVTVEDDGKHLVAKIGSKPVLSYNHAVVPPPNPKEPYYARSGYIHPVFSPSGRLVTDDFNPNHAHQHGIMFAWRKTTCEGRTTNGWDQKAGQGKVEHVKTDGFGGGPVFGWLTVRMHQVDLSAPGGPKPILEETWRVRIDNLTDRFVFDLESTFTCATRSPVTVDEMHYGSLMIRGHAAWNKNPQFGYLTGEGKGGADGNHTRPRWVDMSGPVDGQPVGAVLLDHPGNFRFPQPVRLSPSMPYFCFVPAFLGSFVIEPGKPYVSRYRFVVHDGRLEPAAIERLWADYADPPQVRVIVGG